MSISEHFRFWNDGFQSDTFFSDIRITDVDVGCQISPTLRSMSMPTYGCDNLTYVQSDPFSALPGRLGDSSGDDTQMALLKNGAAPP